MPDLIPSSKSYQELLARLKDQIRTAQVRAALPVNRELILLYCESGGRFYSVKLLRAGEVRSLKASEGPPRRVS
jgi:hypothetical protein